MEESKPQMPSSSVLAFDRRLEEELGGSAKNEGSTRHKRRVIHEFEQMHPTEDGMLVTLRLSHHFGSFDEIRVKISQPIADYMKMHSIN